MSDSTSLCILSGLFLISAIAILAIVAHFDAKAFEESYWKSFGTLLRVMAGAVATLLFITAWLVAGYVYMVH